MRYSPDPVAMRPPSIPSGRLPRLPILLLPSLLLLASCGSGPEGVPRAESGPPAFGHPDSVIFWSPEEQQAGFPNYDRIFPTRKIPASTRPRPLPAAATPLEDVSWSFEGETLDLEDFLAETHVEGLIVLQDGAILLERYTGDHTPERRWVSYSVSKSVVSLLVGAAIRDGYIESVRDPVTKYVPLLEGSSYDEVRIRDLLQMSSGVEWNEDYSDANSDSSREIDFDGFERLHFLGGKPRVAEPGSRFNYSTGEIFLAGAVVRGAIGNNLSAYLHRKIWGPFGMEHDANWMLVEPGGAEYAGCCISATLRDYARLGLFALSGGVLEDGSRVLPEGWMAESTAPAAANDGYGYLWWLNDDGSYGARGIFGQMIHVDPELDVVIAMHSAWPQPTGRAWSARRAAFLDALRAELHARQGEATEVPNS
ncbi:MAG: serine hydrolase domain-containing protein [Longimicrobiales bacterium]|nr:serine hydrolase domain-containing protein [Longimicrobiales bacterium]